MNDAQQLRSNFLEAAARTLFLSAPAISRTLMRETEELHTTILAVSVENKHCCTTCGSILVPPWTAETKFATKKMKIGKAGRDRKLFRRSKVRAQRCSICHRVTKTTIMFDPGARRGRDKSPSVHENHSNDAPSLDATMERTNKTTSKKRAKARKDREGLQTLLNNSVQTRAAPSLNLMDLMRR